MTIHSHSEGAPVTHDARCGWCDDHLPDGPATHDLTACRTRLEEDALTDCPDCAGPHGSPCVYRDEAAAWRVLGISIQPGQLRQVDDQRKDRA